MGDISPLSLSASCTPPTERYNTVREEYDAHHQQHYSTISQDAGIIAFSTELCSLQQQNTAQRPTNTIDEEASSSSHIMSQPQRRPRSSSIDTTYTHSTQSSYGGLHAEPSVRLHAETVGVARGDFSKPRVPPRSRRSDTESITSSTSSARSKKEPPPFKYYGRHSNQWLFNDFSVTDAVAKQWRRRFGKNGEEGDWDIDKYTHA
ncbi:hypothetical protein GMOD_00006273 [Pyrenophora seminiperda CCB06]|uniref:Uncharacterized protein n=1 Tax=Pyrenophora seminiperda CCB06 TaxID=1302712 RepID=A0A3M7M4Y4_9PLEO|nr:hypothetical protein GMOD_00006273 [Pyrenophora seminiperda CCB06]